MAKTNYIVNELPIISTDSSPQVLVTGNGIVLLNQGNKTWEKMIQEMLNKYKCPYVYQEIKKLPASMQVVVASNDQVKTELKQIAKDLDDFEVTQEQIDCVKSILRLPANAFLTTNYSFEIERCAGLGKGPYAYRKARRMAIPVKESEAVIGLSKYFEVPFEGETKNVWHIHGELCQVGSMVMGNYGYGKLQSKIYDSIAGFMKRYHSAKNNNKEFRPKTWVEYFLLGDLYILGLGMYLCEQDLWWLLAFKKMSFPETKVYFYTCDDIGGDIYKMLKVYNVEIISISKENQSSNAYAEFYQNAIKDINEKMKKAIEKE